MHESEKWKWSCSVVSDSSDPMDCSLPGSSVHGIFQAKVLEWGAIAFSISNVYLYENITLFNIHAFYLYSVWLHWEIEVLEAFTWFLMLLPGILRLCWFCLKISQYKSYPWLQLYAESFRSSSKSLNLEVVLGSSEACDQPLAIWDWRVPWCPFNLWPGTFRETVMSLSQHLQNEPKAQRNADSQEDQSCALAISWSCRYSTSTLLLM